MTHQRASFTCRLTYLSLALVALGSLNGCTRNYYRHKVDQESGHVLAKKALDPAWKLRNYYVYPDPRARFADLGDPDRPPMPPDDPAAFNHAPNPQKPGKAGIALMEGTGYLDLLAMWDAQNRAKLEAEKGQQDDQNSSMYPVALLSPPTIVRAKGDMQLVSLELPVDPAKENQPLLLPPPHPMAPEIKPEEKKEEEEKENEKEKPKEQSKDEKSTSNEEYPNPLETKKDLKPYLINLEQALQMALINSREFQDRREDLYLQSLPVTVERFAFSTQFFATSEIIREYTGTETPEGKRNRWLFNNGFGFSKLFSSGALLLFQFANNTVIEMFGNFTPRTTSESQINLDLIQPLLRGGGKAVTLEPLTLVERNLLYEIRDYARFRKLFYVSIATGAGIGGVNVGTTRFRNRPQTFSPAREVAGAQIAAGSRGISSLPASTTGGAGTAGYLQTIVNFALLANEKKNVTALEDTLALYRAFLEGGNVSQLQVDQVEQQLLGARNAVFRRQQDILDTLDQFKLQLGLPITIQLELDDTQLDPQTEQLDRFEQIIDDVVAVRDQLAALGNLNEPAMLRSRLLSLATESALVKGTPFVEEFTRRWNRWASLSTDALRAERLALRAELNRIRDAVVEQERVGGGATEAQKDRMTILLFEIDLSAFEEALRKYEAHPLGRIGGIIAGSFAGPWPMVASLGVGPETFQRQRVINFRAVFNTFVDLLLEARNERLAEVRNAWPELPILTVEGINLFDADLEDAQETVVRTAFTHRLDLMNARAQLVDSWRQIKIAANALLGTFNVEYHLRSNTPIGLAQPVAFSGSRSRHQLTFDTELPLVRILERNSYRASLIAWQRNRRLLMLTQDSLAFGVRSQVRGLRVLRENYNIQKRAVEIAYLRVENALDIVREPAQPGAQGSAANAAALTQQLLGAQSALISAQNQLISLWVNYLTSRMQFYRDLGLMTIDSQGKWIDDPAIHRTDQSDHISGTTHP